MKCSRKDKDCLKCVPGFKISEAGQNIANAFIKAGFVYTSIPFCPKEFVNSQAHKDVVAFIKKKRKLEKQSENAAWNFDRRL